MKVLSAHHWTSVDISGYDTAMTKTSTARPLTAPTIVALLKREGVLRAEIDAQGNVRSTAGTIYPAGTTEATVVRTAKVWLANDYRCGLPARRR